MSSPRRMQEGVEERPNGLQGHCRRTTKVSRADLALIDSEFVKLSQDVGAPMHPAAGFTRSYFAHGCTVVKCCPSNYFAHIGLYEQRRRLTSRLIMDKQTVHRAGILVHSGNNACDTTTMRCMCSCARGCGRRHRGTGLSPVHTN